MIAGRLRRLRQLWQRRAPAAAAPPAELRVLLVCSANLCRSPMAEGVLRAQLQRAGLAERVHVASAGTHGFRASEPPDPRAVRRAAARGYAIGHLRARAVTAADFAEFDWLLAMDEGNLAWLTRRVPADSGARVELLMPYSLRHASQRVVPDPYHGPDAGFEQVLDLVEGACEGVVRRIQAQLGSTDQGLPGKPRQS